MVASLAVPAEARPLFPARAVLVKKKETGLQCLVKSDAYRSITSILLALVSDGLAVGLGMVHWLLPLSNNSIPHSTNSTEE